jgi:hypothetical protein
MLSCQRIRGALEVGSVVCPSKMVVGLRLARRYLGAFATAAWVVFGLAALESPLENLGALPEAANACFCELSSTVSQAYCSGKSRECRRTNREVWQNELQSGLLQYSQRRSRA